MRLLALPDMSGRPTFWVNADHVAIVQRHDARGPDGVHVVAEVKVDGMPLFKTPVGIFVELVDADTAGPHSSSSCSTASSGTLNRPGFVGGHDLTKE